MEAGYNEKVDELCDRYSLEGFVKAKGKDALIQVYTFPQHPYVIM